ncbi:MAG: hypothetical protein AAGC55_14195 [Myxococcota bacterium]
MKHLKLHLLLALTVAAVGCVDMAAMTADEVGRADTAPEGEQTAKRMSFNRMSFNAMGEYPDLAETIVEESLDSSEAAIELLHKQNGPELLKYAARCALPEGDELVVTDNDGIDHAFPGSLGLVPDWVHTPPDLDQQRWIVGCLLAHVNAYGEEVPISLRGRHPELLVETTSPEASKFPYFEGAFFGEFGTATSTEPGVTQMYACYGPDLFVACGGNHAVTAHEFWKRICARGGCDDFTVVGPCTDFHIPGQMACSKKADPYGYATCLSQQSNGGSWPGSAVTYDAGVINVYLSTISCESEDPDAL